MNMIRWFNLSIAGAVILRVLSACDKDEVKYDFIDFEEMPLDTNGYWNGSDGSGGFAAGNAFFPNTFDKISLIKLIISFFILQMFEF